MRNLQGEDKVVEVLLGDWPIEGWCSVLFNDVVKCDVIDDNICV